ncbi:MAG TPA: ribonuclease H-like domain-containing protein [Rhodanobacteraceae bacterium]
MTPDLAALRTLRRQAGAPRRATLPAPGTYALRTPVDTRALRSLLRIREAPPPTRDAPAADRSLPGDEIAPGLRLVETMRPAPGIPQCICGAFDQRDDFDAARVLFFDTETTGLAGGTGTRAFMLGAAAWEPRALRIRQLLLTRLSAETAMLAAFARWLQPDTVLVSYNGKSYDAPLLRTRYRLARLPDALGDLSHVDLLHPTRRRYRGRFENCRLVTIERHVCGVIRPDDLPGSEAPAAWRTYLRGGPAANLRRVLQHNQQDIASLALLLLHLGAQPPLPQLTRTRHAASARSATLAACG